MDGGNAGTDGFDGVLRFLRALATSCEPPVGVGTFDVLYASTKEVVVWYSPARQEHTPGEVTIPCARLAAAWAALAAGGVLDEPTLERVGGGASGGRWLLAVLALLPSVCVRENPLTLVWVPEAAPDVSTAPVTAVVTVAPEHATRQGTRRRKAHGSSPLPPA